MFQHMRNQAHLGMNRRKKPGSLRAATVVCLVLLALLAVIQVTHNHGAGSDADHCPLCIAIHSVVPLVVLLPALGLVRIGNVAPALLDVRVMIRYWHPTLFTRPPPAAL
jgi:hypothetical protein